MLSGNKRESKRNIKKGDQKGKLRKKELSKENIFLKLVNVIYLQSVPTSCHIFCTIFFFVSMLYFSVHS